MSVSVVIPTHNRASLLPRAVESVRCQTNAVNEIIVVDDGSTDGTAVWLAAQHDIVAITQPQRGVSAARNAGVRASGGEWIAFLDSDDEWMPDKVQRQLLALRADPHEICHTDEIWVRNGRRVNPMNKHRKYGGWIFPHCLPLCVMSPSSVFMRRELWDRMGGFDEELPACEDYDLWLRICSRLPVLFVDTPLLVKYGGHADQLSRKHPAMDQFRIRALSRILGETHLRPDDRAAALRELEAKVAVYAAGARRRGRHAEANTMERTVACGEEPTG